MADIAVAILGAISAYTIAPVGRQFRYLFYFNRNITNLSSEAEKLEAKINTVRREVETEENNGQIIKPEVQNWLVRAEKNWNDASGVITEREKIRNGCFNEWCLYLKPRYSVSRNATYTSRAIIILLGEANFSSFSNPPPPPARVPPKSDSTAIASTSTCISVGFQSRLSILKDVMNALKDDDVHTIGICGMGGVGKTTMVDDVETKAREDRLFEEIVKVVVTENQDELRIQRSIADNLGLKLQSDDLLVRAKYLRDRISNKMVDGKSKKVLIILDDLWKELDLKKVGIPSRDEQCSCKIILTTRSREVCFLMKATTFDVPIMVSEEACDLFKSSIHPSIVQPNWKDIVNECGGLPIAITVIAKMLVGKEENTWNYVLGQLKKSTLRGGHVNVFRLSYDFIKDKETKEIFLLCCLYFEDGDIPIEDLVRNGWGKRIFENVNNIHEARVAAHEHAEYLKNLNLLMHSKIKGRVKIHDLVRDFGISIDEVMVRLDQGLKEWPMIDACEQCTSLSINCDEIVELGDVVKYPQLTSLHMRTQRYMYATPRPFKFPERLDEIFPKLQVLSLQLMDVPTLFRQLPGLTNLRTLCLCNCNAGEGLRMIAELTQLEVLTINIDYCYPSYKLPTEFVNLSCLRLLDLKECRNLIDYPGALSSLGRLEEVYLSLYDCVRIDKNTDMKYLEKLFSLHINIPYKFLSPDLNLQNLKTFNIIITEEDRVHRRSYSQSYYKGNLFSNVLHLEGNNIVRLRILLKALLKKTDILYFSVNDLVKFEEESTRLKALSFESCNELLCAVIHPFANLRSLKVVKCPKIKGAFSLSIVKGLSNLEILEIYDCVEIEEIVFRDDHRVNNEESVVFNNLKTLSLDNLPKLMAFSNVIDHEIRFPKLEKVQVINLPKVTGLYSYENNSTRRPYFHQKKLLRVSASHMIIQQLDSLDSLVVINCRSVEVIYDNEDRKGDAAFSTKLTKLCLKDLPELSHVLKTSPHIKICQGFQCLRELKVERCHKLKYLLPLSSKKSVVMLETIEVSSCDVMEAIFEDGEGEYHNSAAFSMIEFPKLKNLDISKMQSLVGLCRSFNNVLNVTFPRLQRLQLDSYIALYGGTKPTFISNQTHTDGEEVLSTFLPANMLNQLLNLEFVRIHNNDLVEVIFDLKAFNIDNSHLLSQLQDIELQKLPKLAHVWRNVPLRVKAFNNLKRIIVFECSSLKCLFTTFLAKLLVRLELLKVEKCMDMESIVANEDDQEEGGLQMLFPHLTDLDLRSLPKLSSIFPTTCASDCCIQKLCIEDCGILDLHYIVETFSPAELVILEVARMENMTTLFQIKPFSELSEIHLRDLPKLKRLWKTAPTQHFENLVRLWILCCDSLRQLFTLSTAKTLNNLYQLVVKNCSVLEEIVADDEDKLTTEQGISLFPWLTDVRLSCLPSLTTIMPKPYYCVSRSDWVMDEELKHLMT